MPLSALAAFQAQTSLGKTNWVAVTFFFLFVVVTLSITYWAARRTKTAKEFYAAGGGITGFQNGLALAGDYMSAASFLGIAGMVATRGYDGLIYSVGFLVGWPITMFLIAEPLRNLGKYTFADVVAFRLKQRPIRTAAATGAIITVLMYLVAQMVGAGDLVNLMFNLEQFQGGSTLAILGVGALMIAYVLFGGMLATTWVQIIKACLLIGGATFLVILILIKVGFNYDLLFGTAVKNTQGAASLVPGGFVTNKLDTISLGVALMFGTAGLPHILMRFYTVPDAKEARKSVFYATGWIGYFYILTFTIGFGAAAFVAPGMIQTYQSNMAAPLLAEALGGSVFLGFLGAVAFATILAVVAGLTLAGATALSHDIYVGVFKKGVSNEKEEVKVAKAATVTLGVLATLIGILFKGQNVTFLVGLAFALAASANFPALLMSILWKRFTTAGALASIWSGIAVWLVLTVLSPTVWVDILHAKEVKALAAHKKKTPTLPESERAQAAVVEKDLAAKVPAAPFPLKSPGLFSMAAAFLMGIVVSLFTREKEAEEKFEEEKLRTYLGIGAH